MRICYINDQLYPLSDTDAEQSVNMVAALGAAGADVELLLPGAWGRRPPTVERLAAYYEVNPNFRVRTLRSVFPSTRSLEKLGHALAVAARGRPEAEAVLYTRNIPTVAACLLYTRRPVVYETYRPWPDQLRHTSWFFRWMMRHDRFLMAVLHSELAADSYSRRGCPRERLLVAHNGYSPTRIEPRLGPVEARAKTGLPQEGPVAVYAGHVSLDKGCGLLLDMAEDLPDLSLVIVGSRGMGPVEQRAATLPNVRVVPWQEYGATVPYLYAADVLLIPPTAGPLEKTGNTVLPMKTFLYKATGRPILGPDTPDLREVLKNGESGILVPPDDRRAATAALRALLEDPRRRERIGARAREESREQTWERRGQRVLTEMQQRIAATRA